MKIVQAPNQVLSTPSKPVGKIDRQIQNVLADMEKALLAARDPEGVGLAAPQIGKPYQIFIVKDNPDSPILTFINPVIESYFDPDSTGVDEPKTVKTEEAEEKKPKGKGRRKKGVQLEGCLSLQDIWGVVKRRYGLVLTFQDETGQKRTEKFEGFMATIIQHEVDHLHGILFPKHVLDQKNKLYKSVKNKKGETEFEEIEI